MKEIKSICVFCGSRDGNNPAYAQTAKKLGEALADRKIKLVYGGGRIGLMGIVAEAAFKKGGFITGIIPDFLMHLEIGNNKVGQLITTRDMHSRKAKMFELSDAFVILPGGIGTLEEAFEIITWKQLGQHNKPIVLVNIEEYWNVFVKLIESLIEGGFAHKKVLELFTVVDTNVDDIFIALGNTPEADPIVLTSHLPEC